MVFEIGHLRKFLTGAMSAALLSPTNAYADELGYYSYRITLTKTLQGMVEDGWEIHRASNRIHYKCHVCEGNVEALLEVVRLAGQPALLTVNEAYLRHVASQCAELSVTREGRCIRTRQLQIRASGPKGFKSESIIGDKRHIHQVFAFHEYDLGPVRISSKVWTTETQVSQKA